MLRGAVIIASLAAASAQAAEKTPIIAVFDVNDTTGRFREQSKALTSYLRVKLSETKRARVVDRGEQESELRKLLNEQKEKSYAPCVDEACQIPLGKVLAADRILRSTLSRLGDTYIFSAEMIDVATETTIAAASDKSDGTERALLASVEQVIAQLFDAGGNKPFSEEKLGDRGDREWQPDLSGRKTIVELRSDPPGAAVFVDGTMVCQDSSRGCSKAIALGSHEISMQRENYQPATKRVIVSEKMSPVVFTLQANFALLSVTTRQPGLTVALNRQSIGQTPISRRETPPGDYEVWIDDRCFRRAGLRIRLARGEERTVELEATPIEGALDVVAEDEAGNAIAADVYVDGQRVGTAPSIVKVSVCARTLELRHDGRASYRVPISPRENETQPMKGVLAPGADTGDNIPEETPQQRPVEKPIARAGAVAVLSYLCFKTETDSECTNRHVGGGALVSLGVPGDGVFELILRSGAVYYGGDAKIFEIPTSISAGLDVGSARGGSLPWWVAAEAIYAHRIAIDSDITQDVMTVGASVYGRVAGVELGLGAYYPVLGSNGEGLSLRVWLGYLYGL